MKIEQNLYNLYDIDYVLLKESHKLVGFDKFRLSNFKKYRKNKINSRNKQTHSKTLFKS